jgi:hypothetical protein
LEQVSQNPDPNFVKSQLDVIERMLHTAKVQGDQPATEKKSPCNGNRRCDTNRKEFAATATATPPGDAKAGNIPPLQSPPEKGGGA